MQAQKITYLENNDTLKFPLNRSIVECGAYENPNLYMRLPHTAHIILLRNKYNIIIRFGIIVHLPLSTFGTIKQLR